MTIGICINDGPSSICIFVCMLVVLYVVVFTYQRGASALLVSTWMGNAKALCCSFNCDGQCEGLYA